MGGLGFAIGQSVVVLGTSLGNSGVGRYATHVCIDQAEVFMVPEGMNLTIATHLGMTYLTAWYALVERFQLQPGPLLLIPGVDGGFASAALQLAQALGGRAIGTTSNADKQQQAIVLGAEACFNYHEQNVVQAIQAWTKGVDVVLGMVRSLVTDLPGSWTQARITSVDELHGHL